MEVRISTWYEHCLQSLIQHSPCDAKNSLVVLLIGNSSPVFVFLRFFYVFFCSQFLIKTRPRTEIDWKLELMGLWEGAGEKMSFYQFNLNPVES